MSTDYADLITRLLDEASTQTLISPWALQTEFSSKFSFFDGYKQHDSQEALRFLFDGLRYEELKCWLKAISAQFIGLSDDCRAWGRTTGLSTSIDRIFAGIILSSLTCTTCNTVYQNFERFIELSLPIADVNGRLSSIFLNSLVPRVLSNTAIH